MEQVYRTWAQVSKNALRHNARILRQNIARPVKLMAVIKADGYGHGAVEVAKALMGETDWFGVASWEEAAELRRAGISAPILILGYTPPELAATLAEMQVTQTVYSQTYGESLSQQGQKAGVTVDCHVKIDSGMNRLGIPGWGGREQYCAETAASLCQLPGLSVTGAFTHFARADETDPDADNFTQMQFRVFKTVLDLLEEQGILFSLRHCCNSAGILRYPKMALDMVRGGIALYGIAPSSDCKPLCSDLHPAMTLHTTVSMVKRVSRGAFVGYGGLHQTAKDGEVIATIGVGYADGVSRSAAAEGGVLIHGQFAPFAGRICMDQSIVNVTHIPQVRQGDVATLVGRDGEKELTFDDWAKLNGTIAYEEICSIGKRVKRFYPEGDIGFCHI